MAIAADITTLSNNIREGSGGAQSDRRTVLATASLTGTYATGGIPMSDLMDELHFGQRVNGMVVMGGGYLWEFDHANQKMVGYNPTAAHTHVVDDLTDLDLLLTDDDSAATNGTPLYLAQERGKAQEGVLWSEMANAATIYIEDGTNALRVPIIHKPIDELTLNIEDDDSAATNGTALYVVPTGETTPWGADLAILQSVNVGNANSFFEAASAADQVDVWDNDSAATAGPCGLPWAAAVYVDEDAATATSRLLATNPQGNANDMYVRTRGGRYLKITHNAAPGTPGVQVYFDDNAAVEEDRLLFVSPTDTTMADGGFGNQLGFYNVEGWWLGLVYADEDATEYARLLCNIPAAENSYVFAIEANRMVQITYNATPGTPGVAVYVDDDAAAADDKLLFVSPTNVDGTVQVDPYHTVFGLPIASELSAVSAASELANATAVTETVSILAWGW